MQIGCSATAKKRARTDSCQTPPSIHTFPNPSPPQHPWAHSRTPRSYNLRTANFGLPARTSRHTTLSAHHACHVKSIKSMKFGPSPTPKSRSSQSFPITLHQLHPRSVRSWRWCRRSGHNHCRPRKGYSTPARPGALMLAQAHETAHALRGLSRSIKLSQVHGSTIWDLRFVCTSRRVFPVGHYATRLQSCTLMIVMAS